MAKPKMECQECGRSTRITDPLDMPGRYCENCGAKRKVKLDPSNPTSTKTDKI
jgi:DNA-directed RNA polymerase subunit RPC12/RpoP